MKPTTETQALIQTGEAIRAMGRSETDEFNLQGANEWNAPDNEWENIDDPQHIPQYEYLRIPDEVEVSATLVGKIFRNRKSRAICQIITQENGRFFVIHDGDIENYSADDLRRWWVEVKPSPTLHEDP
jgi:hypothetical protein